MTLPRTIDLHMHTTVSDGTDTPEEILSNVKAAGIELFAVTDHDAVKACRIIQSVRTADDPAFLTGVEFSCRDEDGKYHILGYGFDPDAEPVLQVMRLGHDYRIHKVRARLEFLENTFGFRFPEDERRALFALDNPGKPHIANLMVRFGYAHDTGEAIKRFINQIRFPGMYVRPEEAIRGILAAGGFPVLAHPSYGSGDELFVGEEMDRRLRKLTAFGLQGVEAFYSGFTDKLRDEILSFADRYGLYVTAGSDYHGTNKIVRLGDTGLSGAGEYPEGLRRFIADTAGRSGK